MKATKKAALLLAACLLLGLLGCSQAPVAATPAAITQTPAQTAPASATPTATPAPANPSFSIANMDVAIGGAEWVRIFDEEALCVYLDYTNTSGMIVQPSNELAFEAEQNEESLEQPRGDTQEQRALIENQHRRLFPGAVNRAAVYFLPADDQSEIVLRFEDRNEDISKELVLDPAALWALADLPASPPATNLADIQGYSGQKAQFTSSFSTLAEGELEMLRHEFAELDGETYVLVYFRVEVTGNMEEGESKDPFLMTHCYAFQDGVQLGALTTHDDRMSVANVNTQYPEVAAHMKNIGPNEPVTTAIIYRLVSGSTVSVAAAFNCSDFTQGEAFVGDSFPVE